MEATEDAASRWSSAARRLSVYPGRASWLRSDPQDVSVRARSYPGPPG